MANLTIRKISGFDQFNGLKARTGHEWQDMDCRTWIAGYGLQDMDCRIQIAGHRYGHGSQDITVIKAFSCVVLLPVILGFITSTNW